MLIDSFEINNLFIPFYFEKKKCLNSLFKQGIIKNALSNDYGKRSVFFFIVLGEFNEIYFICI